MRPGFLGTLLLSAVLIGCGGGGETTTYEVPSQSMEPAFEVAEEVTVELDAYDDAEPEIGDVVTFHPPASVDRGAECGVPRAPREPCAKGVDAQSSLLYLKRVVALPGDELTIRNGQPIVNGETVLTDVIQPCSSGGACQLPKPIIVPPDRYFVMGDDSGASDDSRFWGPVPFEAITGRVSD